MGRAGLGCSVTVDMRLNKTLSRTTGARWGKSAMEPQRMFITSWNAAWWNIRCGRLGPLAEASRDEVMDECGYNTSSAKTTAPAVAVSSVDRRKRVAEIPIHRPLSIMKISPTAKTF